MVALSEAAGPQIVEFWEKQLGRERRLHDKWLKCAKVASRVYWDDYDLPVVYPILNTVVRIKHSALYNENPDPIVRRRFVDAPNYDKKLAQAVERALRYCVDLDPLEFALHRAIDDFLITGLGTTRVRYHADVESVPDPVTGLPMERITNQRCWLEHVPWDAYHYEPQHNLKDVRWVAYDEWMNRKEIAKRFNMTREEVEEASGGTGIAHSDTEGTTSEYNQVETKDRKDKVKVTEIWHKPSRKVYVIAEGFTEPLEIRDDPLNLEEFFPGPPPMLANVRSQSAMPWPDYEFYRHSAETCNRLQARKLALQRSLKDCGFYDAQLKELDQLERAEDGTHVPVANLMERLAAAGASDPSGMLVKLPIENTAGVLQQIDVQLEKEEDRIFRLTGINDLILGATEQYETAESQRIKAQWAEIRLADQFDCVVHHIECVYRIMAELIIEHYEPETISQMTGIMVTPEEWQILQDDQLRTYAIDIEHELSIAQDEAQQRVARNEAIQAITQFSTAAGPLVSQGVWTADFAQQALAFVARGFPEARGLEDAIAALPGTAAQLQQLQQQLQQGQQQIQQMQQELGQLRFQLSKYQEGEYVKDVADAEKRRAEAGKVEAETRQIDVETQQLAQQQTVPPDAALDEAEAADFHRMVAGPVPTAPAAPPNPPLPQ